jgi:hypothetical protein
MLRRAVIAGLLAVAVAFMVFAFRSPGSSDPVTDEAVERRFPEPDAETLRQVQVGVDLRPGFAAVLTIDGIRIPEDQVGGIPQQDEYVFTPGDGQVIERFSGGRHCVTASVRNRVNPEEAPVSVNWCFDVT